MLTELIQQCKSPFALPHVLAQYNLATQVVGRDGKMRISTTSSVSIFLYITDDEKRVFFNWVTKPPIPKATETILQFNRVTTTSSSAHRVY